MSEAEATLDKAERSFQAAEILLREGSPDFAASRAYYGCFYIASTLLEVKGFKFTRHTQVVSQYGLHFARTNELDPRYHQILIRAFRIRQLADYQIEVPVDLEDLQEILQVGRDFLADARRYLDRTAETEGGDAGGEA
jgi:uncharacterized protein (UPF0332 family)